MDTKIPENYIPWPPRYDPHLGAWINVPREGETNQIIRILDERKIAGEVYYKIQWVWGGPGNYTWERLSPVNWRAVKDWILTGRRRARRSRLRNVAIRRFRDIRSRGIRDLLVALFPEDLVKIIILYIK